MVSEGEPEVYSSQSDIPVNLIRITGFLPIRGKHETPVT